MKYLKTLGLAAVAVVALMASVGASSASATVLCSTNVVLGCGGTAWAYPPNTIIELSQKTETTAILETTGGVILDTCTGSKGSGKVSNAGGASETVSGPIESLVWGTCSRTTHTLKIGSLEVHNISGTTNGTVTATGGTEVTINTIFGSCVFGSGAALDIGKVTGGNPATVNTEKAVVPKISGNPACPAHGVLNAEYVITSPKPAFISLS